MTHDATACRWRPTRILNPLSTPARSPSHSIFQGHVLRHASTPCAVMLKRPVIDVEDDDATKVARKEENCSWACPACTPRGGGFKAMPRAPRFRNPSKVLACQVCEHLSKATWQAWKPSGLKIPRHRRPPMSSTGARKGSRSSSRRSRG